MGQAPSALTQRHRPPGRPPARPPPLSRSAGRALPSRDVRARSRAAGHAAQRCPPGGAAAPRAGAVRSLSPPGPARQQRHGGASPRALAGVAGAGRERKEQRKPAALRAHTGALAEAAVPPPPPPRASLGKGRARAGPLPAGRARTRSAVPAPRPSPAALSPWGRRHLSGSPCQGRAAAFPGERVAAPLRARRLGTGSLPAAWRPPVSHDWGSSRRRRVTGRRVSLEMWLEPALRAGEGRQRGSGPCRRVPSAARRGELASAFLRGPGPGPQCAVPGLASASCCSAVPPRPRVQWRWAVPLSTAQPRFWVGVLVWFFFGEIMLRQAEKAILYYYYF